MVVNFLLLYLTHSQILSIIKKWSKELQFFSYVLWNHRDFECDFENYSYQIEPLSLKPTIYLVRDINSPNYFHQSTNIFWRNLVLWLFQWFCEMHFDAPSRFRKGWMISIQKKISISIKKIVNWWIDVTNKI
jgi:hypothetical protein